MHTTPLRLSTLLLLPALSLAQEGLQERRQGLQVVESDQEDRDLRLTPVVRAVQKAADSVVSIYLNHAISTLRAGSVTEGQGSGVILDDSGFVITNWHVIAIAQGDESYSLVVKLKDGRVRPARVLSSSPAHDLALLQLQLSAEERVQPASIGRSSELMVGETVIAIGNPQGHSNTVTSGVLSAIDRSIRVQTPDGVAREYTGLLQTDAAINQGNSGGALLDITGRLIGINNAMAMGAENIGFAIPVDTLREVFETQLLVSDSFATATDAAWLGMEVVDQRGGLVVSDVVEGSPAATAGVTAGDVVLEAGGAPVRTRLDYARRVLTAATGLPFELRLRRGGREVETAARPWTRAAGAILAMSGIVLEEITAEQDPMLAQKITRAYLTGTGAPRGYLFQSVLRVREVQPDSPAAALRLQPGDVLLASVLQDRRGRDRDLKIDSSRDFATLLQQRQGSALKLVVLRGDEDLVGPLEVRKPTR